MVRARKVEIVLSLMVALAVLSGCRVTVKPPLLVADPVTVYLVDFGDTSRLWLPEDGGRYTEWGYGDWRWYALDQNDLLYGPIALLVPTQGALGRHDRETGPRLDDGSLLPDLVGYATDVYIIEIERERSASLSERLRARYNDSIETQHINARRRMSLVQDPSCYWIGHQSTTVVSGWLEELGCDVSGFSLKSNYAVRPPGRHFSMAEGGGQELP
ncbi:MAG TPA: hypothetical protein ENJ00_07050 [Phycisphaerales bacterium]|nr:hypothetical protein [Phycisphaerales bacterium]